MSDTTPDSCPRCESGLRFKTASIRVFDCRSVRIGENEFHETTICTERQRDQLAAEVKRLREWINDLDELARYKGDSGHREWHGDIGWLRKGQVVYLGEEKP